MSDWALLELQALHEAGHAVVAQDLGWPVREVVIETKKELVQGIPSTTTGSTEVDHPKCTLENSGLFAALALAGYTAIRRLNNQEAMNVLISEFGWDWLKIQQQFHAINLQPGHQLAAIYEGVAEAEGMITKHQTALARIAKLLTQKKRISGDEVRKIMQEEEKPDARNTME
jgi:hypothetical protein